MNVLYEDNHLLILEKPAGMLTQPDDSGRPSVEEWGKEYLRNKYQKPGNVFLHAAHRLDRPVAGIVVFARTSKALTRLNASIREGAWKRYYRAWVSGEIDTEGTLNHHLLRTDAGTRVVNRPCAGSKEARLKYTRVAIQNGNSSVEIQLETGRHHQIRAQLAAIGHPILGDGRYGSAQQLEAIALEHFRLIFPHPTLDETKEIILSHQQKAFDS